jgi:hypothetical protein
MIASPKQRMLQRVAELVGHEELALRLNVPLTLLDLWIRGLAPIPDRKVLPLADLLESLGQPKRQ